MATEIGRLVAFIDADVSGLSRALKDVEGQLKSAGSRLSSAGRTLTMGLTLPIVGVGTAAVTMGNRFNESLDQIVGLVGVSREQVNAWKDDIYDISRATAKGPAELAEALYFITSAGIDTSEAMNVLEVSAKAAAAGLGQTQVIADAVTSAMNAYGAENLSAARATDILVAAVREGKVEADALAPVMGRLLPTASAMGIAFEDIAGVMAVMSRTGLDAAEASTSLSAVMSTLLKPSEGAAEALKAAGLSMADLRKIVAQPGGLVEVMRVLDERFGDNDEALAEIIPNVRAFRGVMNVLAQDAATVNDVMKGVADSTGATDSAFKAVAEGPGFQFKQALNEMNIELVRLGDTLGPVIAETLLPLFRDAVGAVGTLVDKFRGLPKPMQDILVVVAGLAAALGPALMLIGGMASGIAAVIPVVYALGAALMFLVANPFGLLLVALAAVAVATYLLVTHWEEVKAFLSENWQEIVSIAATVLLGPAGLVVLFATNAFGIRDAVVGAFGELKEGVEGVLNAAYETIRGILDSIVSAVEEAIRKVKGAVNEAKEAVESIPGVKQIGGAVGAVADVLGLQHGGLASANLPYIVGERGPELFVPRQAGYVVPNDVLRGAGADEAGGGVTVQMLGPVTINARDEAEARRSVDDLAWALRARGVTI